MSKKLFLQNWERSFAEVVKGGEDEIGEPGIPVIKPELCSFKYTNFHDQTKKPKLVPARSPKKKERVIVPCAAPSINDQLDEIIEIMSSPEKTPFKENVLIVSSDTDDHSPVKRARRRIKLEPEDSDSLPSLDEKKYAEYELDSRSTQKRSISDSDNHFTMFPRKNFSSLYDAFSTVNRGLTADEILDVILNPEKHDKCFGVPQYVQEPAAFLIDANSLRDKKDIRADGNGVGGVKNKPKRYYKIEQNGKAHIVKDSHGDNIYQIVRSYSSHKNTPTFRRLIIEVSDSPFLILQFYFVGAVVPVTIKSHGNAKNPEAKPYRRVATSTMKRMTELSREGQSANCVMKEIVEENGGIENANVNVLPRNAQQVRNLKRKLPEEKKDEIEEILYMYDNQTDKFIRKVDIRPDFLVVLASEQQIIDLERFCTGNPFSILGIDPTFNFGDFDVTVTTYRHPLLDDISSGKAKLNNQPVFVGPVCIHKRKDATSYYNFFSCLVSNNNELRKIKAVGTDGEIALANALLMVFENAVHLRCFNHVRNNIKSRLKDIGVCKNDIRTIIADIFGSISDCLKITGLIDCLTNAEFDQKLEKLKSKWEIIAQGFWVWFKKNQSDTMKFHMIQSVRLAGGLKQHETYTTNDNESMNSALQQVCGTKQEVSKFVEMLKNFVKSQENQLLLAIIQQGNFCLRKEYTHLEVPLQTWSKWTVEQRQKHILKVKKFVPVNVETDEEDNTPPRDTCMESSHLQLINSLISIVYNESGINDTPDSILRDMWDKADKLLRTKFGISEIPNLPDARRVISLSNPKASHYVECKLEHGNVCCDCPLYKLHKICHHAVAVAEELGILGRYITWRVKKGTNSSLKSVVDNSLPKHAGKKPNERKNWGTKKKTQNQATNACLVDPIPSETDDFYVFRFLRNTKIMICYGCGQRFRGSITEVPDPPLDLVLARKEFRKYINNYGQLKMSLKKEFVHYHENQECIKMKDSEFDPQNIIVTENIRAELKIGHKELIKQNLSLNL